MHIMWQLQTNKTNFLFKNTQDSYYTTYVGPQDINVFTNSTGFYFYAIISIKYLNHKSRNGTISKLKNFQVLVLNTLLRMENSCFSTRSFFNRISQQFQNGGTM